MEEFQTMLKCILISLRKETRGLKSLAATHKGHTPLLASARNMQQFVSCIVCAFLVLNVFGAHYVLSSQSGKQ